MNLIEVGDIGKYAPFKRSFLYYLFSKNKLKKHVKIKVIKREYTYFDLEELEIFLKNYKKTK